MNPITVKFVIGTVALAGTAAIALMGRRALYGSDEMRDAGPTIQEITTKELEDARRTFENTEPMTVRIGLLDKSISFDSPPSRSCRGCKGMRAAGIAAIQKTCQDLLGADALPAVTRVILMSLGSGSFGPNAYQRNVDVRYEPMPEPPEGWGSPDPLALTPEQTIAIGAWRTTFREWRDRARQCSTNRRAELDAAIAGFAQHLGEHRTDIVSAIEAALRLLPTDVAVRILLTVVGDLEEDLNGFGKQHTATELATWCEKTGLMFPKETRVTVYVSTAAGTLQHIERRWKPFFIGCGVAADAIRFLPLHTTTVAE